MSVAAAKGAAKARESIANFMMGGRTDARFEKDSRWVEKNRFLGNGFPSPGKKEWVKKKERENKRDAEGCRTAVT